MSCCMSTSGLYPGPFLQKVSSGISAWKMINSSKIQKDVVDLVLVGDVAGDVGGDREVLDQAGVDLAEEYNSADAEENEVLELFQKL